MMEMESLPLLQLREMVERLRRAHLFQKQEIATECVYGAIAILAEQERRIKQLETRCNNIQGL